MHRQLASARLLQPSDLGDAHGAPSRLHQSRRRVHITPLSLHKQPAHACTCSLSLLVSYLRQVIVTGRYEVFSVRSQACCAM